MGRYWMCRRWGAIQIGVVLLVLMLSAESLLASSIGESLEAVANRLDAKQVKSGALAGTWPTEADFTGSIVAGLVSAYELTCENNSVYKDSAELGGDYILWASAGNFYGDEAFALTRLSEIASDPCSNIWRTAVGDFYDDVKNGVGGTAGYIALFTGIEPSTAVFYLAHNTVAAFYVDAEDKQIWREGLIYWLAQVDDSSSDYPVMALGVAIWALAQTGPLDATLVDSSATGKPYWNSVTLADLPDLLISHQIPGEGAFYWRFDHGNGGSGELVSGYTEDAIFGTLGLIAASRANPALDAEAAILAGRAALLDGISSEGEVWERLSQEGLIYHSYAGEMLTVLGELLIPADVVASSIGEAIETVADGLDVQQIKSGADAGTWPTEADFTGSIVAGMVSAYKSTCKAAYKDSAKLGGDYILWASAGNFYGDEAFALTRLSEIASDPCSNIWRTAVGDFYDDVKNGVGGTAGYIALFTGIEPSTAVFYMAHHTVAAFYVGAEDKEIWRQGLIDWLAQVDDGSSDYPVMALGIATWALAQTGPLDATLVDSSATGKPYWNSVTLADLPDILASHQIPGEGAFYWRFDHGNGGSGELVSGYTEDAIFGTLGLIAVSRAIPALDAEAAILAGREVLLDAIGCEGTVWERLSREGSVYQVYAGEMLTVLGELIVPGDLNLDGGVDFVDFAVFADNWHSSGCGPCSWCDRADINHDGEVDFRDAEIIANNWLKGKSG